MSKSIVALGVIAAIVGTIATSPAPAAACTTSLPPPDLVGYPSDGATGVSTDVVPFFDLIAAHLDSEQPLGDVFSLHSEDGNEIPLEVSRAYVWTLNLTPAQELEPDTTYTIEARLAERGQPATLRSLTFTTGAGGAEAPLPIDGAFLEHFSFETRARSSCGPWQHGTCLATAEGSVYAASFIDELLCP